MPKEFGFLEVESKEVAVSALKRCETRDSLVVRIYNPTPNDVVATVKCGLPVKEAWQTNMNEERRDQLAVDNQSISVELTHKKIATIEIVTAANDD